VHDGVLVVGSCTAEEGEAHEPSGRAASTRRRGCLSCGMLRSRTPSAPTMRTRPLPRSCDEGYHRLLFILPAGARGGAPSAQWSRKSVL